jgi:hypothetical protein
MKVINNISKKIFSVFSSFLLFTSLTFSQILVAEEICTLVSSQPFSYTGDVSGKTVYTKEEFTFECTDTTTKIGDCKTWKEEYQDFNVSGLKNDVYYQSENFQGSIGELLGVLQAYDKINGLWSGWHGLCRDGADDGNWDWMSDPYVLASFAVSAFAATSGFGAADGVSELGSYPVYDQAGNVASSGVSSTYSSALHTFQTEMVNYSVCAARAGLDMGKMVEEYEDDGEPCDEVDEICSGSDDAAADENNIFTIPEDEYNQLVNNNPDLIDNMVIIDGIGTGVLTIRVVTGTVDSDGLSSEAAIAAAKEAKEIALKVKGALTTIQLASCVAGADTSSGSSTASDAASSLLSAKNVSLMALGAINPLLGMAAQVATRLFDSFTSDIDTCNNLSEAKEKGSRHEATYHAKKYDMCHFIEVIESGDKTWNTYQRKFRYCCYDDKTTRIIVEQAKAQFAKNWEHCTGITLRELEVISFSACDPEELDAGINGVDLPHDATLSERMKAYQFTHECIDTREYIEVLLEKFGGDDMLIDSSDAERIIDEMR